MIHRARRLAAARARAEDRLAALRARQAEIAARTGTGSDPPHRTEGSYCTVPAHDDGEHTTACVPPAGPASPELRLLRAIFGLSALCDSTEPHEHDDEPGGSHA